MKGKICSLLTLLFLTACTTVPTTLAPQNSQTLQGLFGVVADDQANSGHFIWIQQGHDFSLELYGPLGLGATELSNQNMQYTLKTAEGKIYQADSPEALMQEALGWSMPVSGFVYWLWGNPEPDFPFTQNGNVLNQDGWQITYTQNGKTIQKMVMLQDNVRITIVINRDE